MSEAEGKGNSEEGYEIQARLIRVYMLRKITNTYESWKRRRGPGGRGIMKEVCEGRSRVEEIYQKS